MKTAKKAKQQRIEASHLTAHTGFWMRMVSNSVSHAFASKLQTSGVTVAEWVVLREMYSNDDTTSPGVVARLTGLTPGAVSKLISRLLAKGFVTRRESAKDRRFQDIQLTPAAIEIVPKLAKLADQNDREFFAGLSDSDRETLSRILKEIVALHKITRVPLG
ncbi:MAG TPA: MarR family transcriptional regulator [Candidatus Acidoferrales bacterium]